MKIVATCRTRDEERNIAKFCNSYKWADKVLIADGGSEDYTVKIANLYRNVEVRDFEEKIYSSNGDWRNPYGKHINFLIDWAEEEEADWIIFDDCDCRPNSYLKQDYRSIMQHNKKKDFIYAVRIYLWGDDKHFPRLSRTEDRWLHSLWAWKLDTGLRFSEENPWRTELEFIPDIHKRINLEIPPYCLLHNPWQDERMVQKKMAFYNSMPESNNLHYPLEVFGGLEDLKDYMNE